MSRDERIAARLIAAMGPLIPAWCTTSSHDDWLGFAIDGSVEVSIYLAVARGEPDREAVLAFNVLSTIQDVIVRTSTRPWPPASDPTDLPFFRVPVQPSAANGLQFPSRIMVDKIVTVSKTRLGRRIGQLDRADIVRLDESMRVFLGLAG